jgi:hypothetical protein
MRYPSPRAAVAVVAAAVACLFPLAARSQSAPSTAKALVYCPVSIDASGCDKIVTALSGAFATVDRGYDGTNGTVNLSTADINHYALFVIPSLADGDAKPYALLRDAQIAARLKTVVTGRIAIWSGTPDQGDADRDLKNTLIRNLSTWTSQPYATSGTTGTVVLQDFSADVSQRYAWLGSISPIAVTADTTLDVYDGVETLTPAGTAILDNSGVQLAYASMASHGLHLSSNDAVLAGALGGASNRQIVLATYHGGDGVASVKTDHDDYAPGQIVTITGSGWLPGETVSMVLHEDPEVHDNRTLTSVADGSGNFVNTSFSPEQHDIGVKFLLTAVGQTSGRVGQTTFTDGSLTLALATAGTGIPSSQANSFTWQVVWSIWAGTGQAPNTTCAAATGQPTTNTTAYTGNTLNSGSTSPSAGNQSSLQLTSVSATGSFAPLYAFDYWSTTATSTTAVTPGCIAGNGGNATFYAHFKVVAQPTTLTVAPISDSYGATVNLSATLNSGSSAVSGKTVTFALNGATVGTAVTDAAGVATLGASLSSVTAGTYATGVTASFAGDPAFSASSGNASLTVAKAQTHTAVTSHTPDPSTIGQQVTIGVSVTSPTAPPPSGAVAVSLIGDVDRVSCTATITNGVGSCQLAPPSTGAKIILASFPSDANYGESTSPSVSHQVNPGSQTITFAALANKTVGDAAFTVNATASSGLAVSFAVGASDQCTIAGSTVSLTGAGNCTVTASQAGNGSFAPAPNVSQTFQIAKGSASVVITSDTPDPSLPGQQVSVGFTVSGAAGAPAPTGSVTVSDGVSTCTTTATAGNCGITLTSVGVKTLTATFAGDNNYLGATSAGEPHQVGKADAQTVITAHTPDPSVFGQAIAVSVSVTSPSGATPTGQVTVSFSGGTDQVSCTATLANGAGNCSLTPSTAGPKSIVASFSGDANYNAGTSATVSHQVNQASQTITFAALANKRPTDAPFTVSATASSGLSVVFTVGATDQCTISGDLVTITGSGSCTVTASQPGNTNFAAAPSVSQTFAITKAQATVAITSDTPDPSQFGQSISVHFTVSASGSAPAPTGNVTVSDGSVTCTATVATGSCDLTPTSVGAKTLTATYAGDANFDHSASAGEAHEVDKASTHTTIASHTPDPSAVNQDVTVTVSVTSPTAPPPSSTAAVAMLGTVDRADCTATITNGVGSCVLRAPSTGAKTILASFSPNDNYGESTSPGVPHQVGQASQTISFGALANKTVGDASFTVSATASSGLAVSFAVGATDQCTISGSTVSLTGAGSCTVTASQAGNATYAAAPNVSQTFQIAKTSPSVAITADTPDPSAYGQSFSVSFSVTGPAGAPTPTGNVTVSDGTTSCVSTVTAGGCSLALVTVGSRTLTATYGGDNNYLSIPSAGVPHQVTQATQTISFGPLANKSPSDAPFTVNATASSGLVVSFAVGATDQCTISGTTVSLTGAGSCTVTASQAGNANYAAAPNVSQTFQIVKASASVAITADTPDPSQYGQQIDVSFTVSGPSGAPTPTGNVTVSDGVTSCAGTVAGGHCALTPTSVGAKTLTATYAGDNNYQSNTSAGVPHQVSQASQTITFGPLSNRHPADPPFTVNATATSGLPVTFAVGATDQCTISGNTVSLTGSGNCTVTASQPGNTNFLAAPSVSQHFTIAKDQATVAITSDAPDPSKLGEAIAVRFAVSAAGSSATPTGNVTVSDGAVSCSAAVSLGTCALTPTSIGAKTLRATYSGDANFDNAVSADEPHQVNKGDVRTIITDHTPAPSVFGQAVTVGVSVTASGAILPSGSVAVSLIGASDAASCTATLTNGAGSCSLTPPSVGAKTILATFAGDANYNENTSPSVPHQVNQATATLAITNISATYDGSPKSVTVTTSPSGLSGVSVSYNGSATAPTDFGTYPVTATLDNPNYTATAATATLTISKAIATITLSNLQQTYDGTAKLPTVSTAPGNLHVTLVFAEGGISSTNPVNVGSYPFIATIDDKNYDGSANGTLVIGQASTTTSITAHTPSPSNPGQPITVSFSVTAAAGTPTGNVTVSDGTVSCTASVATGSCALTPTAAGAKTLTATYGGDLNFTGSTSSGVAHTVQKASQSISFGALGAKTYGDAPFTVSATASSGLAVSFSAAGPCTVSGAQVTLGGAGTCTIAASQGGNGNYAPADVVPRSFEIGKAILTVAGNSVSKTYGALVPQLSGNLSGVVSGDGITATFSTAATAASPVGSYDILPALNDPNARLSNYTVTSTKGTLTITQAAATLTLGGLTAGYDGTAKSVTVTTSPAGLSGVGVTYAGSPTVPTNAGSYAVVATLTNDNYTAPNATGTLVINKAAQTISFSAPTSATYGDAPFTVTASTSSGLPVTITASGSCTISGTTVTITGAGSCDLTAAQSGNVNYLAATSVPRSVTIAKGTLRIVWNPTVTTLKDPATLSTSQLNATIVRPDGTTFTGTPTYWYGNTQVTLGTPAPAGMGIVITAKYVSTDPNYASPADVSRSFDVTNAVDFLISNPFNMISLSDTKTTEYTAAFLTTANFNAATVVPSSVTLGDGTDPDAPVNTNADGTLRFSIVDVNMDGKPDLLVYFKRSLVNASGITTATTQMVLRGQTTDGRRLKGTDKVSVSP